MIKIDAKLLATQFENASNSQRNRTIHTFHEEYSDILQRMLNTGNPGTYCQPHKHENPDKREVFILLTGSCAVVEYNDNGEITDYSHLDHKIGNIGVEIKPGVWHHHIVLEPNTCVYELKDGPYDPNEDKDFADWAPKEGSPKAQDFLNSIIEKLNLNNS